MRSQQFVLHDVSSCGQFVQAVQLNRRFRGSECVGLLIHLTDVGYPVCGRFFPLCFSAGVIQSEGFEHLRVSCPSLQAELLQAVAGVGNNNEILASAAGATGAAAGGGTSGMAISRRPPLDSPGWAEDLNCDGSDPSVRRVRLRL